MKNIIVSEIEFMDPLYPLVDDRNRPFIGTSLVSPYSLPHEVIVMIRNEMIKGRSVVPVKITIKVMSLEGVKNITEEISTLVRRTLKAIEYVHSEDRGAIGSRDAWFGDLYIHRVLENPCTLLKAISNGQPVELAVVGFLTRVK